MNLDLSGDSRSNLLTTIEGVNGSRRFSEMHRRLLKLSEELGEATEAYLAITGSNNYKDLTPANLREELVDVVLVGLDAMLYRLPGEEDLSREDFIASLEVIFARKIAKWRAVGDGITKRAAQAAPAVARVEECAS